MNTMNFKMLVMSFLLTIELVAQNPCKEVVGYYPGWQWYDRNKLVNPATIRYQNYSILNYAFFKPESNGGISLSDPWGDKNILLGPINWATSPAGYESSNDFGNATYHHSNQKFSDYCHAKNVKLLISIGGWTYSGNFSSIAADPLKRAKFATDCQTMVQLYNLDGIDIDWEYPGYNDGTPEHNGVSADKQNFTIFLQQIRNALTAIEPAMGKTLLLTAAVGASPERQEDVEWNSVKEILDIVNVMTYDFYGAFNSTTGHNAPLYPAVGVNTGYSCSEAINNLLTRGVPANKITMGLAHYGRSTMCSNEVGLNVASNGQVDGNFSLDEGSPQYYNIIAQLSNYDYNWDDVSKVPYLTGKNGYKGFLSYDNEASILEKAKFINEKELKGGIIWEITGDYIETFPGSGVVSNTPLTDVVNDEFCNSTSSSLSIKENNEENSIVAYPNPFKDYLLILCNSNSYYYVLTDESGRAIVSHSSSSIHEQIDTKELIPGIYFLKVISEGKVETVKIIKN
jgi:chitinase